MQNNTEEAAKQYAESIEVNKKDATLYKMAVMDFEAGVRWYKSQLSDASKEEPKGLEELRMEFKEAHLMFPATMSIPDNSFNWFLNNLSGVSNTKSSEAVDFLKWVDLMQYYKANIRQVDGFTREVYMRGNNISDEFTEEQLYTEFLKSKGITPVDKCPTFLEVMKENTELKIRLENIRLEKEIWETKNNSGVNTNL